MQKREDRNGDQLVDVFWIFRESAQSKMREHDRL